LDLFYEWDTSSGAEAYYGYDGHGSTRFLTDTGGNLTDAYTYDAYGSLISQTFTGSQPMPNNYLYCGEQWDSDLGQYNFRARTYNPGTGRFPTADSSQGNNDNPLSLHKYLYCQDNPVNMVDPDGHDAFGISMVMMEFSIQFFLPELLSPLNRIGTSPEEGERILIARYNMAKAYLESRNVKHGGSHQASCWSVNSPIGHFLGPPPEHWICKMEHRGHLYGLINLTADHWAVICRTTPDVPQFREMLFDYWGDRPAGENPGTWFRAHYSVSLEGSFDYTYGHVQKPCDYGWLDAIPVGAD